MPKKISKRRNPVQATASAPPAAVTATSQPCVKACDLSGLKYFKQIRPLLESLHEVGAKRDRAQNRELHTDQYACLVLMWMFNPVLTSLRGLQQASQLEAVQNKFGVRRASLGSLSESATVFDPEPLKQIAATLATEVPSANASRFDAIGFQNLDSIFAQRSQRLLTQRSQRRRGPQRREAQTAAGVIKLLLVIVAALAKRLEKRWIQSGPVWPIRIQVRSSFCKTTFLTSYSAHRVQAELQAAGDRARAMAESLGK